MAHINWLHFTDFHQKTEPHFLWPNVRERVYEDLTKLFDRTGPWDLVLFTGDLAFSGQPEEFQRVNDVLDGLWNLFAKLGCAPRLLAVPGNHDLVRPEDLMDPTIRQVLKWDTDQEFRNYFWEKPTSPYHQKIKELFAAYCHWWKNHPQIPKDIQFGALPGDFAFTLDKNGVKLGILGINTAFLQLTGDDYKGRLALHVRQFHAACGELDGPTWANQHHACLLLTHHPPEWLNKESRKHLFGEINAYGRFAVHLCGHAHDVAYFGQSDGGTQTRWSWQGKSLFGLEHFGAGNTGERLHGYTVGEIRINTDTGTGEFCFWPREARKQGNQYGIVPDTSINTGDTQHTIPESFKLLQQPTKGPPDQETTPAAEDRRVPMEIRQKIVAFLTSLPGLMDSTGQQAFIFSAGLDAGLKDQFQVGRSIG